MTQAAVRRAIAGLDDLKLRRSSPLLVGKRAHTGWLPFSASRENDRNFEGRMKHHDFYRLVFPIGPRTNRCAGILGCADSRVGPEYAFDIDRPSVFVCR